MFALLNVLLLLGVVLAQEPKGHEYYSNLRHLQKSEKYIAPPQEHDHEYYSNLKHLNHEGNNMPKDHTYYSNLRHLNHDERLRQDRHEYYANLHHINHGSAEGVSPQPEKNEDDVHHPQHDHEYYANLHHLNHESEPEMREGKGHEYYSHLHHLSRNEKQNDHEYYSNLHHLHRANDKYVHGGKGHEYYAHMHHLHRGHMHHLHGCKDDYHHHGHRSHSFFWMMMPYRMLCSPDECVPASVKTSIMQSWTETGRQIFDECNPNGQCDQNGMGKIIRCMFKALMNKTEITVQEYRATINSWSVRSMANSCENDITLKMIRCSRPQLHHLHHHRRHYDDNTSERHELRHRMCNKHARPTPTPAQEEEPRSPQSDRMASPPHVEDDVSEPEEEQEESVHQSRHNARHHFQYCDLIGLR